MAVAIRLTPTSQKALDEFDEAAKIWGWEQDQGHGSALITASIRYTNTHDYLTRRIYALERKIRRLQRGQSR